MRLNLTEWETLALKELIDEKSGMISPAFLSLEAKVKGVSGMTSESEDPTKLALETLVREARMELLDLPAVVHEECPPCELRHHATPRFLVFNFNDIMEIL